MIVFSTANAFHRQEKTGSIKLLTEIAFKKGNNVNIKILTPFDNRLQKTKIELENVKIEEDGYKKRQIEDVLEEEKNNHHQQQHSKKIQIKFIESQSQTTVSILIVDRKYSLVVELKDDTKDTSSRSNRISNLF